MLFYVGSIQRPVTAVLNLSLYNAIDDSQPEVVDSYHGKVLISMTHRDLI